jgi:hypothetical protein
LDAAPVRDHGHRPRAKSAGTRLRRRSCCPQPSAAYRRASARLTQPPPKPMVGPKMSVLKKVLVMAK